MVFGSISVKVGRPFSQENHAPLMIMGIVQLKETHGVTEIKEYLEFDNQFFLLITYTNYIAEIKLQKMTIPIYPYYLLIFVTGKYNTRCIPNNN